MTTEPLLIDKEKLAEIIKRATEEIAKKKDGESTETIATNIADMMKEVLKDDN